MKIFKKFFKSKLFLGATLISVVTLFIGINLTKNDIVLNDKIITNSSTRDVVVAEPNVYESIIDISNIGADINDYRESFLLADSIQPFLNTEGSIELIKIEFNKDINWDLNGGIEPQFVGSSIKLNNSYSSSTVYVNLGAWTNSQEHSTNINEQKNSFSIKQVNAKPEIVDGSLSYNNLFDSIENQNIIYKKSTLKAPPYPDDDLNQNINSPNYYYQFENTSGKNNFDMNFSPVLINFSAKTIREVPNTNVISKYDYYPYIKSSIREGNQYNVMSGLKGEVNPKAELNGMFFSPENSFSSFSGIFDAIPNSVATSSNNRKFGQYIINSQTRISDFSVNFNSEPNKLPSQKLKEIESSKNFFNPSNFNISADNAIPSTFYGSKLKITANDNDGTLTFELIPGIGATVGNTDYGAKSYDLVKPHLVNINPIVKSDWKRIENTYIKKSYTLNEDDYLYQNAVYAQLAVTDNKYIDKIKELIKEKIIFGNVPPTFGFDDIKINNLDYLNKEGKITFDLYLKDFYDQYVVSTSEKNFGKVTINGFKKISSPTVISQTEININEQNVLLSEWLKMPNLNEKIISLINSNGAVSNLPEGSKIFVDSSITRQDHPPKAIVTIGANKIFKLDEVRNDYYIDVIPEDNLDGFLPLGDISFVGFEEIWATEINIDPSKLNNNKKIYPSQYTVDNATDLIYESVVNVPNDFTKKNIIIKNFSRDNVGGSVSFDVQLNKYYDATLNLINNSDNFLPVRVVINNFKKALGPTTFIRTYSSVEWSQLTVLEFSDDNINSVIREKVFTNLLSDSNVTYTEINRDTIKGEIIVSGSVDKYFDANSNYKDIALGDNPLLFTTNLVNFLKTAETTIHTNTLNVSLPNISPLDVNEKTLKNKLLPLINSKPKFFNVDNILFQNSEGQRVYNANNTEGTIIVNLGIDLWYDKDGLLQNTFKDFGEFTFTGLKITRETILPSEGWDNSGNGYIASEVAKNKFELLAILNSRIIGDKPDYWNPMDDIIICDSEGSATNDVIYDNKQGTIELYAKLKRFYNTDGILETQWNKDPIHIIIGGFQKLVSTTVLNEYTVPNVTNRLPTEYSIDDVKTLIKSHKTELFTHLPTNFDVDNDMLIEFNSTLPNPNNLNGTINIDYSINNYYNFDGILETNPNRPLKGSILFRGFKNISETVVNKDVKIPNVSDVVASTLSKQQVIELVERNVSLFFNSTPDDGVIINNINITNNELNLEGKLEIEITYSNYYDQNGNLVTSPTTVQDILLSGFKKVKKTTYNTNIILPIKNELYPSDLSPSNITNILSDSSVLPLFLVNYPPDFSARDILEVKITERNNLQGSVTVDLKIVNYYDDKGNIQSTNALVINNVIINNFSSNKPTEFFNQLIASPSDKISNEIASEIANKDLQKFIFENISKIAVGLPSNFSMSNLRNVLVLDTNNLEGTMKVEIGINNYIDQEGVLQTTSIHKWTVNIKGFRTVVGTEINPTIHLNDVSTIKPSDVDNVELINIIMRNKNIIFNSLPDKFNEQNIIIKSLEPNDSEGFLVANISITSYYSSSGKLENANNPLDATITFFNFGTVEVTKINGSFELKHVNNYIASEYPVNRLKELIFFNLNGIIPSLPENFSYNDIKNVEIKSTDNTNGTLLANITITNFFDPSNGLVDTINTLSGDVLFTGFKNISQTVAVQRFEIKVSSNVTADHFNDNDIKNYISIYYHDIFSPLPNNFTIDNIKNVEIVKSNNLLGEINVNVTLDSYFDENSRYSTVPKVFNFVLFGFTPVKETTFVERVTLDTVSNISAYSLSPNEIIELIYSNKELFIQNTGPNFSISNINFNTIDNIDNVNGILEVSINYTNYYDSKGKLILDKSILKKHFISGFATNSKITEVVKNPFFVKGYSNILPQELAMNSDSIKEIIYQNINSIFKDIPQEIVYSDISINNIQFDNTKGYIYLKLLLSKYYDKNSILVNDNNKRAEYDVVLAGFKTITPTTQSLTEINEPSFNHILASSSIDIYTIKNYLWGKKDQIFNSLPSDITLKDFNIEISSIDNISGSMILYITLFKWYSNTGELQNISSNSYKLVLRGFKQIKQTIVNRNVNISFPENSSLSSYYAETVTSDDVRNLISYNKDLFFNYIPSDFNNLNIQSVQILSRDNIKGKINIKFSYFNYFDQFGNIEKNNSKMSEVVTINGFFNVQPTTTVTKISVFNECYNNLASDYKTTLFNELNDIIVSKEQEIFNGTIPHNAKITLNSVNSINNLEGTANVTISVDKYYNDKGILVNDVKNYSLTLVGFKNISNSSTIAGQNFSSNNTNISININQFDEVYWNYFLGVIPSNISTSPESFINILTSALNSNEILKQNGLNNNNLGLIKISKIKYKPNTANDIDGTLSLTAEVSNYWDNINGEFNTTPLPIVINLSGFKTTISAEISSLKIIIFIIVILVAMIICLLIALLIAKLPKFFKKKI